MSPDCCKLKIYRRTILINWFIPMVTSPYFKMQLHPVLKINYCTGKKRLWIHREKYKNGLHLVNQLSIISHSVVFVPPIRDWSQTVNSIAVSKKITMDNDLFFLNSTVPLISRHLPGSLLNILNSHEGRALGSGHLPWSKLCPPGRVQPLIDQRFILMGLPRVFKTLNSCKISLVPFALCLLTLLCLVNWDTSLKST